MMTTADMSFCISSAILGHALITQGYSNAGWIVLGGSVLVSAASAGFIRGLYDGVMGK